MILCSISLIATVSVIETTQNSQHGTIFMPIFSKLLHKNLHNAQYINMKFRRKLQKVQKTTLKSPTQRAISKNCNFHLLSDVHNQKLFLRYIDKALKILTSMKTCVMQPIVRVCVLVVTFVKWQIVKRYDESAEFN